MLGDEALEVRQIMGRIDEALRRAAAALPVSAPSSSDIPRDDVFHSPWSSSGSAESRSAPPVVAQPGVLAESTTTVFRRFIP
jgi:hypothetical protein